jgi:hypothetical protein
VSREDLQGFRGGFLAIELNVDAGEEPHHCDMVRIQPKAAEPVRNRLNRTRTRGINVDIQWSRDYYRVRDFH